MRNFGPISCIEQLGTVKMRGTILRKSKPILRIIVIGYYGHLNAGDDLLQQAMAYIFQDHKLMFTSWQPSIQTLNECDLVVVGGGSIWPGYSIFQSADQFAKALRAPLMVLGISSKQADAEVLLKTRRLIEKSVLFHVRDVATYREFGSDDLVRSGVDLFWWMPWKSKKINKASGAPMTVAVNLREWQGNWSPDAIMNAINNSGHDVLPFPLYFGSPVHDANIKMNDVQILSSVGFSDVVDHWSEGPLLNADICVAMRYHAILISVRMHTPVIGFDFHPKMVSFFEENDISELCIPLNEPERLMSALKKVTSNHDRYVAKFRGIAEKLEAAGVHDLAHCRGVLSEINPRHRSSLVHRVVRKVLQYV